MIPRRTLPRVPLLGQRGSSEFQLETIAGCFFMVVHGVHQFIQPVTRQSLEQITVTHITGGQPVAVAFYIRYQIIKHRLSVIGGNHSQEQRQGIAALASRTILTSVLVIKLPMECLLDFLAQTGVTGHIIPVVQHTRSFRQIAYNHIIMGGSHQRNRRITRETGPEISIIIPVTQSERNNSIIGTGSEVINVTTHSVIIFSDQ